MAIRRLVKRLWDDSCTNAKLSALYTGPSIDRPESPSSRPERHALSHPLASSVDIDISRIEAVLSMNSFAFGADLKSMFSDANDVKKDDTEGCGIFDFPSYCNHECWPSATRSFTGDVMICRAARRLQNGDEVTLSYIQADFKYAARAVNIDHQWGFVCECSLCQAERIDGPEKCDGRVELLNSMYNLAEQARTHHPSDPAVIELYNRGKQTVIRLKESYANTAAWGSCPKLTLFMALHVLSTLLSGQGQMMETAIETDMDMLESIGLKVVDRGLSETEVVASVPIDTEAFGALHHYGWCVHVCIRIAARIAFFAGRKKKERSTAWLKAARWCMHHHIFPVFHTRLTFL